MTRVLSPNLVRAGVAGGWIFAGRLIGLGWTAALVAVLGIGNYGQYAIAFALAAIIAAPLDNPFGVRALRVELDRYLSERTARAILGGVLLLAGVAVYFESFVVGFALVVSGGEIAFNALKSRALRDGFPNLVQRWDVARQVASVVLGLGILFLVHGAPLSVVCAAYLVPYLVVLGLACAFVLRARPALPAPPREVGLLFVDALALAAYVQGDILLLGALAGSTVAGVYSLASLVSLAAVSLAQMYAQTFHERLRLASGARDAGPSARSGLAISVVLGALVLIVGVVVLATGLNPALGWTLVVMSVFTALRSTTVIEQTVLYLQGRDARRVLGAVLAALLKLVLIAELAWLGSVGAGFACVLAEALLLAWFVRLVRRHRAKTSVPEPVEGPVRVTRAAPSTGSGSGTSQNGTTR